MSLQIPDTLLEAMRNAAFYPHTTQNIQVIHTHISVVFLTGEFAYKLKKPVNFGFLDFTQLASRKHFCEEELRINRRLAPTLYLDALPILQTGDTYRLGLSPSDNAGTAVEYAVKMRQFDPQQQLDRLLQAKLLPVAWMDRLAHQIAQFHQHTDRAPASARFGLPGTVITPMQQNFTHLRAQLDDPALLARISTLEQWTLQTYARLHDTLLQRKQDGHIRDCHGDMHLGNIALVDDEITIFDGIEFSDELRWIDTASEIAFLVMDLEDRGAPSHAHRILNVYLSETGDYDLLTVLKFYQVYRAMVRAKVNALRLAQNFGTGERAEALLRCASYVGLAERYLQPSAPKLLITHGLSGSGKSFGCRALVDDLGMIQIRSDVERKRFAAAPDIYSTAMTARTYDKLAEIAALFIQNGYSVVVDATFLQVTQRRRFRELARAHGAAFLILNFTGTPEQLETNILHRQQANNDVSDADIAVLHKQLAHYQPLQDDEPYVTVRLNEPLPLADVQML